MRTGFKPTTMTPQRWRQFEEAFHAAMKRGADDRVSFLDEACAGDEALGRDVEALLTASAALGEHGEDFQARLRWRSKPKPSPPNMIRRLQAKSDHATLVQRDQPQRVAEERRERSRQVFPLRTSAHSAVGCTNLCCSDLDDRALSNRLAYHSRAIHRSSAGIWIESW